MNRRSLLYASTWIHGLSIAVFIHAGTKTDYAFAALMFLHYLFCLWDELLMQVTGKATEYRK